MRAPLLSTHTGSSCQNLKGPRQGKQEQGRQCMY